MGTVTSATLIHEDGAVEQIPLDRSLSQACLPCSDDECVAYGYAYAPDLFPHSGTQGVPADEGMWRYRDLLPLDPGPIRYPLEVGGTPLVASPRLRERVGMEHLYLKDETRSPTGSNKDRATALVLEQALREGVDTVTCASTGNVAVSLAVGAAAAGIEAVIFVPATVSDAKLQVMLLAGATVVKVEEGYAAAFTLSRTAVRAFGWYDRNTGVNPVTLEAKKTVAFEVWEQLGHAVPDAVVVPVGDGPTLCGMAKGFRELAACGLADRMPRVIGVQAEGCQPLKRAWERGETLAPCAIETLADGIAVVRPTNGPMVLRDVRGTGGGFVAVSDDAMLEAIRTMASTAGIIPEPAAAAGLAALSPALDAGLITHDDTVVVLVTGSGLKTPQYLRPIRPAITIRGDLADLEHLIPG